MPFDISNGLSLMGSTMAKTLGDEDLEKQRAALDLQKITLADQLAGAREHVGRVEAGDIAAKAQATQNTFTAAEDALKIKGETAIARIHVSGELGAASISAASAAANRAQELFIAGHQLGFDAAGRAITIDPLKGTTTPLLDSKGQPASIQNPAQQVALTTAVRANQDMLVNYTRQADVDVKAAQDNLDKVALTGTDDDKAKAQARLDAVADKWNGKNGLITGVSRTLMGLSSMLIVKGSSGTPSAPSTAGAVDLSTAPPPPLSSFHMQTPGVVLSPVTGAPQSGIINGNATQMPSY